MRLGEPSEVGLRSAHIVLTQVIPNTGRVDVLLGRSRRNGRRSLRLLQQPSRPGALSWSALTGLSRDIGSRLRVLHHDAGGLCCSVCCATVVCVARPSVSTDRARAKNRHRTLRRRTAARSGRPIRLIASSQSRRCAQGETGSTRNIHPVGRARAIWPSPRRLRGLRARSLARSMLRQPTTHRERRRLS